VLEGARFGAGVRAAWPIEFWHQQQGPQLEYLPPGVFYQVPPECMQPADPANLLCTGRSVSATPQAAASLRVAGVCMALGGLAGELAADMLG
jgi:hypothetical protein